MRPWRTRLGTAGTVVAVMAMTAGIFVAALDSRGGPPVASRTPSGTPSAGAGASALPSGTPAATALPSAWPGQPTKPPVAPTSPPTPWATPEVVSYVIPASMSFPGAQDGWAVGDGCDPQNACEAAVARTTDGGDDWALVSPPVDPRQSSYGLQLLAASGDDAWVWGTDADGAAVFTASHDGGQTWQPIGTGSVVVSDLALDGGTVWAVEGCPASGGACADHVLSSPVTGGAWTDLGPMPLTAQVAPVTSVFPAGPVLVRAGGSAWVLTTYWYPTSPALVRSDNGGATWTTLGLPCQATMSPLALAASSSDDLMMVCGIPGVWPAPQEIWASDDGGATWLLRSREFASIASASQLPDVGSIGSQGLPSGVLMLDVQTAWIWGDREQDLVSHDGGVTWTAPSLPYGNAGGAGMVFADPLHGWTFGAGEVWVTSDGGASWECQPIIGRVPDSAGC